MQRIVVIGLIVACMSGNGFSDSRIASVQSRLGNAMQSVRSFFMPTTARHERLTHALVYAGLFAVAICTGVACLPKLSVAERDTRVLSEVRADDYDVVRFNNGIFSRYLDGLHNYRDAHVVLGGIQERYSDYYLAHKHDQKQEFYGAEAVVYYLRDGVNLIGRSRVYRDNLHPQHIEVQHADGASHVDVREIGGMLVTYDFPALDPTLVAGVEKTLVERIVESSLTTKATLLANIVDFNTRYKTQVVFPVDAMQPVGGWIEEGGEAAMFGALGGLYADERYLFTLTKEQLPTDTEKLHGRVIGYFTDGQLLVAVQEFSTDEMVRVPPQGGDGDMQNLVQKYAPYKRTLHEIGLGDGYHPLVVMVNKLNVESEAPLPKQQSKPATDVQAELTAPDNLYRYTRSYNSLLSPMIALAWDVGLQERNNFERGRRVRFAELAERLYDSEVALLAQQLRGTQLEVEFALMHLSYFRTILSKSLELAGYPSGNDLRHVLQQLNMIEQRLLGQLWP